MYKANYEYTAFPESGTVMVMINVVKNGNIIH